MLQEFAKGLQKDVPTTILGFREHIFTGSVSSLANYMALQVSTATRSPLPSHSIRITC
jgi:hypothetical protein